MSDSEKSEQRCDECGAILSNIHVNCPHCGACIEKNAAIPKSVSWDKITAAVILLGFLVLFVYSGLTHKEPNDTTSQTTGPLQSENTDQKNYDSALNLIAEKKFEEAVVKLSEFSSSSPYYEKSRTKIKEIMPLVAGERLQEAKKLFSQKNYTQAYDKLLLAYQVINPPLPEAKKLLPLYEKKKNQQLITEEKEEKKRAAQEAAAARKTIKDNMNIYEGDDNVVIAVGGVKLKRSTELHVAQGNGTFVYVFVNVKNVGNEIIHANPNDFTLSTPTGETVSHESDTYSLGNYFDAVDLRPGNSTSGWLIFYIAKSKDYTLNYQGFSGTASKKIAI